jgi:hypothetical protein
MADDNDHKLYEIEIALLKQRMELMEKNVQTLDSDIKGLRSEMKLGFEKVIDRFDTFKAEMMDAKSFGKGVYWIIGGIAAFVVAFKDQLIQLLQK